MKELKEKKYTEETTIERIKRKLAELQKEEESKWEELKPKRK